jgi:3-dehydroquinate synthase
MKTLTVAVQPNPYPIHIGAGLLARADLITPHLPQKRAGIVTNETIAPLYLDKLKQTLASAGVETFCIVLPDGEKHKNWETLNRVYDALIEQRAERKTTLIALGGGVVGDITGFAAATYQRGVPFIQVPTTLLAQVDSAVGGKTGVNHARGKNMIGAFYQPKLVLADTSTLDSLPAREFSAGLAEVIKYGLIRDLPFFEWLEANMEKVMARERDALTHVIYQSCRNKAEVVAEDEKETGVRAILNLGHTFGHAIETGTGYGTWLHGEAVAMGIMLAAELSRHLGNVSAQDCGRVRSLFSRARLPIEAPDLGIENYVRLMVRDKKVESGSIRFVLLRGLGQSLVSGNIPSESLGATLALRYGASQ